MRTMELRRVPYGTTFTAFGDQFVALDYIGGGVLAIRKETWKNAAFDSNGVNDLRSASIGQAREDYLETLMDGGAKIGDILDMYGLTQGSSLRQQSSTLKTWKKNTE